MSFNALNQQEGQPGVCEACLRIDRDNRIKNVTFCPLCNAWLCDSCKRNWPRRAKAAALRQISNLGYHRGI